MRLIRTRIFILLVSFPALTAPILGQIQKLPPKPTVTIQATDPNALENFVNLPQIGFTSTGTFTVTRTAENLASALTVSYSVSGTATPGSDYNALPGTVTIPG